MFDEIRELITLLNYHTKYYDMGEPKISDREWDDAYFRLTKLEEKTGIRYKDSPTQRIPYEVVNELKKIEHDFPMLSLDKTKDIGDIKDFIEDKEYIAMAKMDGLTCAITYENGELIKAETRGNGYIGEDITHNILVNASIPNVIPVTDKVIVYGEIISTLKNFKRFKEKYKNPRNFAAGSIRLLDNKECKKRGLSFIAWDVIGIDEKYLSAKLDWLENNDFDIVPYSADGDASLDIDHIIELCENYPIDGIVFKYDDCEYYESLGRTEHHFKGGLAFKFYDELYDSILIDFDYEPSRKGVLTPVAVFEPIDIDGSTVSRATLHNISIMKSIFPNGAYKGDNLKIYKANEIIPQIQSSSRGTGNEIIPILEHCPICGAPLKIKVSPSGAETLMCESPDCSGKFINQLEYFCGKKGLDIKGLSKKTLEKLVSYGWIKELKDIFLLKTHKEEWILKEGFGKKSVENILDSIDKASYCTFETILRSMGIPLIGSKVSKIIAQNFKSYDAFKNALDEKYDFSILPDCGAEIDISLSSFDYKIIDNMIDLGYIHLIETEKNETVKDNVLNGITFVITGKVSNFKNRNELKDFIESYGGTVSSSVSNKTNYLINNDDTSMTAKNKKAKELGIEILTEEKFLNLFAF